MSLPPQHTPELFGVGITFCNCNIIRQLETDVCRPGLALRKAIRPCGMFAWEPFAENDNSSSFRHHAVWAIAAPFVFRFPQRTCQHNECPTDHLSLTPLSSGDFFGWQWRAHGRNGGKYAILGKYEGRGQVGCHFAGFPKGNYSGSIGDAWRPSKPKVGS